MLKVEYQFNRSLLTERSRDLADARNASFWTKLQELSDRDPETVIEVRIQLVDRYGALVEVPSIRCAKSGTESAAQALCGSAWEAVPMVLKPGVDRKDVSPDL